MRGSTETGRTAEFLVCYVLQCNGIEAHHVNASTDIIATLKSGRLVRIEVKGSSEPVKRGNRSSYLFSRTSTNNAEWYAFVALDKELVFFVPSVEIKGKSITIHNSKFSEAEQKRSVESISDQGGETK